MWPSVEDRPPSYMVDVVIKYMWEYGVPYLCTKNDLDPRPYINSNRRCYLFWKATQSRNYESNNCTICKAQVVSQYWVCPRCNTIICGSICAEIAKQGLTARSLHQHIKHPFPKDVYQTFNKVSSTNFSKYNNRQWIDPKYWRIEHHEQSPYNFIAAFFLR